MHGPLLTFALVGGYTLLGCAAFEIGYRAHSERAVFALKDWRAERIEYLAFGDREMFDPVLGWASKERYEGNGYNTLDHGIRRNFDDDKELRTGAILAVGASFTNGGPDIDDDETWPAQLESITGTPASNAGVEGYATDQIVLRAEQLLPVTKPKTLIVGFAAQDIAKAHYSSSGAPKPYFTLDNNELTYHPPSPIAVYDRAEPAWQANAREILGYSAVLDVVLSHIAPDYWHGTAGQRVFRKVENDPVGVTCALLQRLKRGSDGARLLLFIQYGFQAIVEKDAPGEDAKKVAACATAAGIDVVDEFASLRAIAVAKPDALRGFYQKDDDDDGYGLMSAKGNRHAAELLARALGTQS